MTNPLIAHFPVKKPPLPSNVVRGPEATVRSRAFVLGFGSTLGLTPAETSVLNIAFHETRVRSEIAARRFVCESTVKKQIQSILTKAEVCSLAELVILLMTEVLRVESAKR